MEGNPLRRPTVLQVGENEVPRPVIRCVLLLWNRVYATVLGDAPPVLARVARAILAIASVESILARRCWV